MQSCLERVWINYVGLHRETISFCLDHLLDGLEVDFPVEGVLGFLALSKVSS